MPEDNKSQPQAQDTNWDDISFLDDMELGDIDPESYQEQEDDGCETQREAGGVARAGRRHSSQERSEIHF